MGSLPPNTTQMSRTEFGNVDQIDHDVCSKIVQELASKVREVLSDPSVIQELAQHEANARSTMLRPSSFNNGLSSRSDSFPQQLSGSEFFKYNTSNLEAANQYERNDVNNNENDEQDEFLSCSSNAASKTNLSVFENCTNKLKPKRITYALAIAVVVLIVTILTSTLTLFVVWLIINSSSILVFNSVLGTPQSINELIQISVGSSYEYNIAIGSSNSSNLAVQIELERPGDWPTGTHLQTTTNVKSIRVFGPFHSKKLISLLDTVSSLEMLELVNKDNHICIESMEPLRLFDKRHKVSISIRYLSLEYFKSSTCVEALKLVYENIEFSRLEAILIKDGEINPSNVELHENMLHKYRKSLRKLEISATLFETGLFYSRHDFRFDNVKSVMIEASIAINMTKLITPIDNICSLFPNVETVSFGMTPKQYNELLDLFDCKKLKSLQIRIWIPYSNSEFSLSFLTRNFPNLESADLTLSFGDNFPVSDEKCRLSYMRIDGKNILPKLLLANIRLGSNCRLQFED